MLSAPHGGSGIYELKEIDVSVPDEAAVILGQEHGRSGSSTAGGTASELHGYPFPAIQDEFERLRQRWREAGLNETEFDAWPAGAAYEDQLRRIRKALREAEAA